MDTQNAVVAIRRGRSAGGLLRDGSFKEMGPAAGRIFS